MNFKDYSHRHGKELISLTHPNEYQEICSILERVPHYAHGSQKNSTPKEVIAAEYRKLGWEEEVEIPLGTGKSDYCDLGKNKVFIEQEYSRFEMFFRDFFRFMLLYERREIDAGIIITFDEMAYQRWEGEAKAYKSARASFQKLVDFLKGDYASVVSVPLWCIGIE